MALWRSKLLRIISYRDVILNNDGTQLVVTSIGACMKGQIVIGIAEQGVFCDHGFNGVKSMLMMMLPCEFVFASEIGKRG